MLVNNKYVAGLLTVLGTLVAAFALANADNVLSDLEIWQIVGLAGGSVVAVIVPLAPGAWAALFKVGGNVIVAGAGGVIGVITTGTGWDRAAWYGLVFIVVQALLTQLGVSMRVDSAKAAIASPAVNNSVPIAVDPAGVKAAGESKILEESPIAAADIEEHGGLAD